MRTAAAASDRANQLLTDSEELPEVCRIISAEYLPAVNDRILISGYENGQFCIGTMARRVELQAGEASQQCLSAMPLWLCGVWWVRRA